MSLNAHEQSEMYRLMRKVHRLTASRAEQDRYRDLARRDTFARALAKTQDRAPCADNAA